MKAIPSEKKIKEWYDHWHKKKKEKAWRPYEAYGIFLEYLNVESQKKLLDIGCGTGFLLKSADEMGLRTFGIDISSEAAKIARRISPKSNIVVGKGEKLPFSSNFFHYITCIGSLEHFLDIDKSLNEFIRVGKKGALYCIVVPNINFLYWKLRRSFGTHQQAIKETLLTKKQWIEIFTSHDFEIVCIKKDLWHMKKIHIFSSWVPVQIMKNLLLKIGWVLLPLDYTYQFVFVLRKKTDRT